jgi:proteic killer suppression protein
MKLASNNFEALRGDRHGQYSIRINLQWPDDQKRPVNIEIVDYH